MPRDRVQRTAHSRVQCIPGVLMLAVSKMDLLPRVQKDRFRMVNVHIDRAIATEQLRQV